MGMMNFLVMLKNYSTYSFIGTLAEMYRQVAKSKGDTQYLPTSMAFAIIISLVIGILIFSFVHLTNYTWEVDLSLYLLIPMCLFFLLSNVIASYLVGIAKFKTTTTTETVFVLANTIITVSLAYYFGYLGAVVGLLIAVFIRFLLYYNEFRKLKLKIKFELDKFIFLLKNGINLFINSISATLYIQLDSLIVVTMLGPASLGIYGIASTLNNFIYSIFGSTIAPLGQKMLEKSNQDIIKNYLHAVTTLAGYTMIFPIMLIVFISPFLIDNYLPLYTEAIVLIGVLAPAAYFNIILGPINNYLVARNRERTITISTLIATIINVIFNIYFIIQGYGLIGIALSTSIAYMVNFILLHYLSKTVTVKQFLSELFPLFYMILFLYNYFYGLILLPIYIIITYYVFSRRGVNLYLKKIIDLMLKKEVKE
jgi:O-antigen/teichoic acid export membrane protein